MLGDCLRARGARAWCAFLLMLVAACGRSPSVPLANVHDSAESLARAVLGAVAQRDEAALRRVSLDEHEFRAHVWPGLPAARPERNLPFSYVWGDLHQKSEQSLKVVLATHGGRVYDLMKVRFGGESTRYPGYVVHRDAVFVVRDPAEGEKDVRVCGSMIEKGGEWKVFSYVVDD